MPVPAPTFRITSPELPPPANPLPACTAVISPPPPLEAEIVILLLASSGVMVILLPATRSTLPPSFFTPSILLTKSGVIFEVVTALF